MYKMFFPSGNAEEFCDHVFRTFDMDKNGYIDFKVSLSLLVKILYTFTHIQQQQQQNKIYFMCIGTCKILKVLPFSII